MTTFNNWSAPPQVLDINYSPARLFADNNFGCCYDMTMPNNMFKDTAMTIPVSADGDKVAAIKDLSGKGYHMLQATPAAQATYKVIGGKSLLRVASGQYYATAAVAPVDLATCYGFAAFQQTTEAQYSRVLSITGVGGDDLGGTDNLAINVGDTTNYYAINLNNTAYYNMPGAGLAPLGNYEYILTASQSGFLLNGVVKTNLGFLGTRTRSGGKLMLFAHAPAAPANFFIGDVSAVIHVGRVPAVNEINAVRSWMQTKIGVAQTLS